MYLFTLPRKIQMNSLWLENIGEKINVKLFTTDK